MCRPSFVLLATAVLFSLGCRDPYGTSSQRRIDPRRSPEQIAVAAGTPPREIEADGHRYRLSPLAHYEIAARVLSRERYYLGWRADLSPLDLALGWGALADPDVDRYIDWHQGGRWYFYHWPAESPYRNDDIVPHSVNVHVIPANANVRVRANPRFESNGEGVIGGLRQRKLLECGTTCVRSCVAGGGCSL